MGKTNKKTKTKKEKSTAFAVVPLIIESSFVSFKVSQPTTPYGPLYAFTYIGTVRKIHINV